MIEKKKVEGKQSIIAETRREQIVAAAIQTLDEIGYVKTSLSEIAQRANISTGLISYHFSDKYDLIFHVLEKLLERTAVYVMERTQTEPTAQGKLNAFIAASLAYQWANPAHSSALVEIVFNGRTPDNIPFYKLGDDEEDPLIQELRKILIEGQQNGEFGAFHVDVMAHMIQGAIGEYMAHTPVIQKVDLQTYTGELNRIVARAIKGQ